MQRRSKWNSPEFLFIYPYVYSFTILALFAFYRCTFWSSNVNSLSVFNFLHMKKKKIKLKRTKLLWFLFGQKNLLFERPWSFSFSLALPLWEIVFSIEEKWKITKDNNQVCKQMNENKVKKKKFTQIHTKPIRRSIECWKIKICVQLNKLRKSKNRTCRNEKRKNWREKKKERTLNERQQRSVEKKNEIYIYICVSRKERQNKETKTKRRQEYRYAAAAFNIYVLHSYMYIQQLVLYV